MAKTKIRMLGGTGGEWQVGKNPWGEVDKAEGTTKPTTKQYAKIKRQDKAFTSGMKKRTSKGK